MNRLAMILLLLSAVNVNAEPRFVAVDIILDSREPVAAWQFELHSRIEGMLVVGIENGDSAAFNAAPFYDRDAVAAGNADHVIVADYSLAAANELPRGNTRIATVHLILENGDAEFDLKLITANMSDGRRVDATIRLIERTGS